MTESPQPLRSDICNQLLEQISLGKLPAGSRIVESRVAEEFGVSRTPVREALLHLERDGVVRSELARGFLVSPLSRREILETYPMLWTLECLALRSSAALQTIDVASLLQFNREFLENAQSSAKARLIDCKFHETLIAHCGNSRLLSVLANIRRILGRYEQFYMEQENLVKTSAAQHQEIIDAIREDKIEAAVAVLESNWRGGMDVLLDQLRNRLTD